MIQQECQSIGIERERERDDGFSMVDTPWRWWWWSSSSCHAACIDLPGPHPHASLSSIAPGRSSRIHPLSGQTRYMWVLAGCPAFDRPCEGVHRSMSIMSSSLLLQQCPACLVRLTWIVFVMGGKWPYSCFLWGAAARTCSIFLAVSFVVAVKLFLHLIN